MRGIKSNGENLLRTLTVVVDRECNALRQKRLLGKHPLATELVVAHLAEAFEQFLVMRTHLPGRVEHFVEEIVRLIVGKKCVHGVPPSGGKIQRKRARDPRAVIGGVSGGEGLLAAGGLT